MSIGQIRWRNDPDSCTTLPAAIQHCPQLLDACTIKMLLGGYVSVKYYRRQFMSITDVQPTPSHYITTCSRRQDRHQTLCSLIYVRRYNIIHTVPSIPPTPQTQNRTPYPRHTHANIYSFYMSTLFWFYYLLPSHTGKQCKTTAVKCPVVGFLGRTLAEKYGKSILMNGLHFWN